MTVLINSQKDELKISEQTGLTYATIMNMIWCLGLSLFWVVFLWRFWEKGVLVLGVNACLFLFGLLAIFFRQLYKDKKYGQKDLYWLVPLGLISLSYLFYANPFIKIVNLLAGPPLFIFFINYGFLNDKERRDWNINFITKFIFRFFSFLGKVIAALNNYLNLFSLRKKQGTGAARKIVLGLILLAIVAFTVIIPLLSAADPVFGDKLSVVYDLIRRYIADSVIYRLVFFLALSLLLFSWLLAWTRDFDYAESQANGKQVDSVVSGIVLGGILALYLLFLWVQLERLWIGTLPFEFRETEALVKSGFWQLFFLTGLNTLFYYFTYRRTNALVQRVLTAFTAASLLLLVSAGQRMALYVINYGFSYEKFFASYTVIYSGLLFAWLFYCLFRKERANILKFMAFLFLWLYAIITVLPVEQFIMRSNVALARRQESRIRLSEMTMLSSDVLNLVKKYKNQGLLNEKAPASGQAKADQGENTFDWQPWIDRQEKLLAEKRWYEFNF